MCGGGCGGEWGEQRDCRCLMERIDLARNARGPTRSVESYLTRLTGSVVHREHLILRQADHVLRIEWLNR